MLENITQTKMFCTINENGVIRKKSQVIKPKLCSMYTPCYETCISSDLYSTALRITLQQAYFLVNRSQLL